MQTYWSVLKAIFNGKKIPVIPPCLIDGIVLDFKEKANIFNEVFGHRCTPLNNGSEHPNQLILYTNKKLSPVVFDD